MTDNFKSLVREEVRELPYYVPGKPIDEVKRELGLKEVYKLASNENPWGPSPKAIKAMQEALEDVARYPDSGGYLLKETLAESFKLTPEHFLFGSGSDELVQIIGSTFFRPGDEILMGRPTFPRYETVARLMSATPVEIDLADGYYPLEGMLEKINSQTRAIFICNPNNPSGTVRSGEDIRKFVKAVPENILLIFDEAYYEFMEERFTGLEFFQENRPIMVLRTFSKAYGLAGVRLGFVIAHPELISAMNRVRPPFNANSVAQAGALAAWQDQVYLEEVVRKNKEGRRHLTDELQKLGARVLPSETNFVLAFFPVEAAKLSNELLKRGVIVRPGTGFGYPDAIRITVGTPAENAKLLEVLQELL